MIIKKKKQLKPIIEIEQRIFIWISKMKKMNIKMVFKTILTTLITSQMMMMMELLTE